MKKLIFSALLLSIFSVRAKGQEIEFKGNSLSFTPSTLLHLTGKPGLEFGYERYIYGRISLNTELTYVRDFFDAYDVFDFSEKFKGFATGASIRFYTKSFKFLPVFDVTANESFRLFAAPGFYYGYNSRIHSNDFYRADSSIYLDEYKIVRNEMAYYIDLGLKDSYKNFNIELVGGFGYIYRNTTHFDRENENDVSTLAEGEYFLFEHEPAQLYQLPLIRLQITIGYSF
ncbi:MAG: hypothetical protein ACPGLV_12990 [Bacteroidia bacterium]